MFLKKVIAKWPQLFQYQQILVRKSLKSVFFVADVTASPATLTIPGGDVGDWVKVTRSASTC